MTLAYIASPIDGGASETVRRWRVDLRRETDRAGWACYWPDQPWSLPAGIDGTGPVIAQVNQAALEGCDVLVALLPRGDTSLGVPTEILWAVRHGKPVVVVTDRDPDESVVIADWRRRGVAMVREIRHVTRTILRRPDVIGWTGGGQQPSRVYPGDAGFDLYVSQDRIIAPAEFVDIPCGISIELPAGVWAWIVPRSSTLRTKQLIVHPGVIDNGYRGELFVGALNPNSDQRSVKAGERLAQLIPMPVLADQLRFERWPSLASSERDVNGFGSSGS